MPGSTTVSHNGVIITFNEDNHSYIDEKNRRYTSVTTLIGLGFEPFDSVGIAKRKAGANWEKLVLEWKEKGRIAAEAGTRLHENCERLILNEKDCVLHIGRTEEEKKKFSLAEEAVWRIKNDPNNIKFEPEKLVFSPRLKLAGSIDLLVTCKDGSYHIFDWKNIKGISQRGFNGKTGILDCTKEIQDCNFFHYALQLQIYEIILKMEGYIPLNAKVKRTLNVFENGSMNQYPLPSVAEAAKGLIKWNLDRKET